MKSSLNTKVKNTVTDSRFPARWFICLLIATVLAVSMTGCKENSLDPQNGSVTDTSAEGSVALEGELAVKLVDAASEFGLERCKDLEDLKEHKTDGYQESKIYLCATGNEASEAFYKFYYSKKGTSDNDVTEAVIVYLRNPGIDMKTAGKVPYDLPVSNIFLFTFNSEERAKRVFDATVTEHSFRYPDAFVRKEDYVLSAQYERIQYYDETNEDDHYPQFPRRMEKGIYLSGNTIIIADFERAAEKENEFESYVCSKLGLAAPSTLEITKYQQ